MTWTAYFDESGTHDGSPFLVVAGYVFDKEAFTKLEPEWKQMLDDYGLTHFHMADCAIDPGFGEFAKLTKTQREGVERRAIQLIKQHMTFGWAVSIDRDYESYIGKLEWPFNDPYTFACMNGVMAVQRWAHYTVYQGRISYMFEAGAEGQGQTRKFLEWLTADPYSKEVIKYASHGFANKVDVSPLQCADILAWQWYTFRKNLKTRKRRLRKDLKELFDNSQHWLQHYDGTDLKLAVFLNSLRRWNRPGGWGEPDTVYELPYCPLPPRFRRENKMR